MTPLRRLSATLLAGVAIGAVVAIAAHRPPTAADLTAAAQSANQRGDLQAAVIALKSAVQLQPASRETRLLLGRALLQTGDPGGAEAEFRKALALGTPPAAAHPLVARALLAAGNYRPLIDQYGELTLSTPQATAELRVLVAAAQAAEGRIDAAKRTVTAVLATDPAHVAAQLLRVRLLVREKDVVGARALLDSVLRVAPRNAEAWQLLGDLKVLAREPAADSIRAYRSALALDPIDFRSRANLVSLLLQQHDSRTAATELAPLVSAHPRSGRVKLLQAQIALERKDYKTAREITQVLLLAPDARSLELAAVLETNTGSLLQAQTHLVKALQLDPESLVARRLLTQIYLRVGQPAQALTVLQPMLEQADPAVEFVAQAAEAYMQLGDAKSAEAMFVRALKHDPGNIRLRTGLALARLSLGDAATALAELQAIASVDPGGTADLALASAHVASGSLDAALAAIDGLQKKQTRQALPPLLRGRVLMLRKEGAKARSAFEQSLALDATYFPAIAQLVALDVDEGQSERARQRLQAVLARDPDHYPALTMLAGLKARAGQGDEVVALLNRAIKARPDEGQAHAMLVTHLLRTKETARALAAAEQALGTLPDDPAVLDAAGRAELANGRARQAATIFTTLSKLQPASPLPLMQLAQAHSMLNDRAATSVALKKALDLQPDLLAAQRARILLALRGVDPESALSLARTVQQQRPREAVGFVLEGDVEAARGRWVNAAESYRRALANEESPEVAAKRYAALMGGNKEGEATDFAQTWRSSKPREAMLLNHLGDGALARGDVAAAEAHYRNALSLTPEEPQALNNLAWVLALQGKPDAVALAEKADRLQPHTPAIMDTLAAALAADKQLARAIEVQLQAVALSPANPRLKFNLAKLYLKAGEKSLARRQLNEVAKSGANFRDQKEVKTLLAM